jgi:hypothetical protein
MQGCSLPKGKKKSHPRLQNILRLACSHHMDMYFMSLRDLDMILNVGNISMTAIIHKMQIADKKDNPGEKRGVFQFRSRIVVCRREMPITA